MAVYTEVSDEELGRVPRRLRHRHAARPTRASPKASRTPTISSRPTPGSFILTLYEKRVHEADLPFFLGSHAASRRQRPDLSAAGPQPARQQRSGGSPGGRPRSSPFSTGFSVRRPTRAALRGARRRAGATARGRPGFRHGATECALAVGLAAAVCARRGPGRPRRGGSRRAHPARARASCNGLAGTICPTGIIHADLFTDNVFFIGREVSGLIDFYFACTDALAYDVAICLNAWCFEPDGSFNLTKGAGMFAGYQAVRPLDASEIDALPVLCRGSAMRFMLTRLVDWLNVPPGALVKPKDPLEYDRKLALPSPARNAARIRTSYA